MDTKTKTIRLSEEDLMKIELIQLTKKMNFNNFVKFCIHKELSKYGLDKEKFIDENTPEKNKEKEDQKITIRLNHSSMNVLKKIAKKKGLPISREAKFRLLATLYDDVYEPSELKKLQIFLYEVKKIGQLLNLSIQENLLIRSEFVKIIGQRLNGVETILERIILNNRLRNKDYSNEKK